MAYAKRKREALAFKNPRRAWVMAELKKLLDEWEEWEKHSHTIKDHPYDSNTQLEVFADGILGEFAAHDLVQSYDGYRHRFPFEMLTSGKTPFASDQHFLGRDDNWM